MKVTDPSATANMDDAKDVEKGSPSLTPRSSDSIHHSCSHAKVAEPTCSRRCFTTLDLSDFKPSPRRILKAVPAVTLGAILNLLDVVSTGMLIFPSDSDPLAIWLGMAVYMMSIVSIFPFKSPLFETIACGLQSTLSMMKVSLPYFMMSIILTSH